MPAAVVMRFRFSGIYAADKFAGQLKKLNLPAKMIFIGSTWEVETTSDCLKCAPQITKFLTGKSGRVKYPTVFVMGLEDKD